MEADPEDKDLAREKAEDPVSAVIRLQTCGVMIPKEPERLEDKEASPVATGSMIKIR
jgi:hypothetical protein